MDYINKIGYHDPHNLITNDVDYLKNIYDDVNADIKSLRGEISGKSRKKDKNQEDIDFLNKKKVEQELLIRYKDTIADIMKAKEKYQSGKGIFFYSPQELIKRLELLGGSLAAGNNGVLYEYIQIAL